MKISDIVKRLEDLKEAVGDVEVVVSDPDPDAEESYMEAMLPEIVNVKHYCRIEDRDFYYSKMEGNDCQVLCLSDPRW